MFKLHRAPCKNIKLARNAIYFIIFVVFHGPSVKFVVLLYGRLCIHVHVCTYMCSLFNAIHYAIFVSLIICDVIFLAKGIIFSHPLPAPHNFCHKCELFRHFLRGGGWEYFGRFFPRHISVSGSVVVLSARCARSLSISFKATPPGPPSSSHGVTVFWARMRGSFAKSILKR